MAKTRVGKTLSYEQQWAKWENDIRRIYTETVHVFKNRLIFREIVEMFKANPDLNAKGGYIWDWINGLYGRDMVLAVRRELDLSLPERPYVEIL